MSLLDLAATMLVVVIWAFNFVAGKIGLTELSPLLMLGLRFVVAAVLLAPFFRLPLRRWRLIVVIAFVLGGLHFGLVFTGLQGVQAGPAAIAIQLTVPFSALLAWIVYGERMGWLQLLGMLVLRRGVHPPRPGSAAGDAESF